MQIEQVWLKHLVYFHEPENLEKVNSLICNMEGDGWQGKPLIGWDASDGNRQEIWLANGSHRFAAAKEAGLESIPVVVIAFDWDFLVEYGVTLSDSSYLWNAIAFRDLLNDEGLTDEAALIPDEGEIG